MERKYERHANGNGAFTLPELAPVVEMDAYYNHHLQLDAVAMRWKRFTKSSVIRIKDIIEYQIDSLQKDGGGDTEDDGRGEGGSGKAESGGSIMKKSNNNL